MTQFVQYLYKWESFITILDLIFVKYGSLSHDIWNESSWEISAALCSDWMCGPPDSTILENVQAQLRKSFPPFYSFPIPYPLGPLRQYSIW